MTITVGEVLQLQSLLKATLLAGKSGLNREVQWVNIQEVLDCLDLLNPGEFLITTGFGLGQDLTLQVTLIKELAARELSCLAIQTGFYLDKVPATLIEQADYLGFPLIELPKDASFRSLTEEILRQVVDRQNQLLEYADRIQTLMTEAAMQKQDLGQIAQVLAEIMARPVHILTPAFAPLGVGRPKANEKSPFPETGKELDARLKEEFALISDNGLLPGLHDPKGNGLHPRQIKNLTGVSDQVLIPIWGGNKIFGYLSALESSIPFSRRDLTALSRAAVICSFIILKEQAALDAELKLREDFLTDLLSGSFGTEDAIRRRASLLGYDLEGPQTVLKLEWESTDPDLRKVLMDKVKVYLETLTCHYLVRGGSKDITVILGGAKADSPAICSNLVALLGSLVSRLYCGVGEPALNLCDLQLRYAEAEEALRLSQALGQNKTAAFFSEMGVYRLLFRLKGTPELREFYDQTIASLVEYDQNHFSEYIETLETYFGCGGNGLDAARNLYIHRHTLTYRLERIKQITGLDPNNPSQALQLQLGLVAARLLARGKT